MSQQVARKPRSQAVFQPSGCSISRIDRVNIMADLWTRDEENCLISFYRKHSCLWKSDDKDYTNRIERKKLYFKLALELASVGRKCTIKDITNKYRNLKSIYYRELKKVKEAYKNASESDDIRPYIPRWEHFNKLRFLPMYPNAGEFSMNAYNVHPDVQCNIEIKEEAFEDYSEQDGAHNQETSSLSEASENDNLQLQDDPFHQADACTSSYTENATSDRQNEIEVCAALDFYRGEKPRKRHFEQARSSQDDMMPAFSHFKKFKDKAPPVRDDVEVFLELLGRKLRRLTPMCRESTEMEIHQVVHQALLHEMSSSASRVYPSNPLSSSASVAANAMPNPLPT